jgi:hypothetical protein
MTPLKRALLTMLPLISEMLLILLMLPLLTTFAIYARGWLVGLYLATFIPLCISVCLAAMGSTKKDIQAWTLLLPTVPIWLLIFVNVGKPVARLIPWCCSISAWKKIDTSRLDKSGERIHFVLGGGGWETQLCLHSSTLR